MEQKTNQKMTIEATVIRADGRVEPIGVVVGGNRFQKVAAFFRIKLINFKQKWLQSSRTPGEPR